MKVHDFNKMFPWAGMRRCILNPDGSRVGYLDENNSNLWEDGTEVDWAEVESLGQNCVVEIPKFHSCKKVVDDERIFGVSKKPTQTDKIDIDDWRIDPAFYRARNVLCTDQSGEVEEVDFRYAPAFKGFVDAQGRLRSLPNKSPTVSKTIGQFRTHAANNGNGWGQFDFNLLTAIQMLYITEYGDPDGQTVIGKGITSGAKSNTGQTLEYGNNSYGETTGTKSMSYRGIEDLYGNVRHWIDGMFNNASRQILVGNKGFNDVGVGYKNLGQGSTSNLGGYIGDIQDNVNAGFIIKATNGSATSKLYDYGLLYAGRLPYHGGTWADALNAGVFYLGVGDSASYSSGGIGGSLCF